MAPKRSHRPLGRPIRDAERARNPGPFEGIEVPERPYCTFRVFLAIFFDTRVWAFDVLFFAALAAGFFGETFFCAT
jgi:hypothetical protein